MRIIVGASLVFFSLIGTASAGTITAVGAVTALTNVNQLKGIIGNGNFDEGPTTGNVPLNVYQGQGLLWRTGLLSTILPGCPNTGTGYQPGYDTSPYYPAPIGGGGVHNGQGNYFGGVATFSVPVTQVGLTASTNGTQYLTAWRANGTAIGQVTWTPASDSSFVGIDTMGVNIAMITYGNHDVWAGQPYDIGGATIISDSWIWAAGKCTANSQCDDGNLCTDDTCNTTTGVCSHVNNTAPCSDNNACTVNDACSAGSCKPGTAVTCSALDGCHSVGVCNPSTGVCSNPLKANGSACSDNNACTMTDTCQNGVCTAGSPVMCAPPDSCHNAGTCDMTTGMCTYAAKADGTTCDDSNACTTGDVCMGGTCKGMSTTTCKAMDACHDVGMCDTTTGMCTNPAKSDGASCDDGNSCTMGDTCQGGTCAGTAVSCMAPDECHTAGTCDSKTGCSNPPAPDGTTCTGGTCKSGVCTSTGTGGSGTGGSTGNGGHTGSGGHTGTGAGPSGEAGGCKCGVADSAGGGTPAAALLMLLALRRRRRAARA